MINEEIKYNIKSLVDVILTNNEKKLINSKSLLLNLKYKDNTNKEILVNKDNIFNELCLIFEKHIVSLSEIEFLFINEDNKKIFLTSINVI